MFGDIYFDSETFLLVYRANVLLIHEWHERFVAYVQTLETVLLID